MGLIDYARIVWKHKWIMLLVVIITVGTTAGVTYYLPPTYTATATLKVKSDSSFSVPGYISPAKEADLSSYEKLVSTPQFKQEALNLAKEKYASQHVSSLELGSFSLSVEGLSRANFLVLKVGASHPGVAKALTNAAAELLIRETTELELGMFKELRKAVTKERQSIDKELAGLRLEMEDLKAQPTAGSPVDKSIKMAHLQDEINAAESLRRTYNDFLARLSLNDLAQRTPLQLIYPAIVPPEPSSPSLPKNLLVSFIAGLLLGMGAVVVLDRVQKKEGKEKIG